MRSLIAAALFGVVGCSLAVDLDDVDRGCGTGRKLCGTGHCVNQRDPAYGCSLDHCEPCALTNAIPDCDGEICIVDACLFPFGCQDRTKGCAANLLIESNNCGACGVTCLGATTCRDGVCVPR